VGNFHFEGNNAVAPDGTVFGDGGAILLVELDRSF